MKSRWSLILYLLLFVFFAMLIKILGFAYFDNYELLSVIFVAYGSGTVYGSMGNNRKISLFIGSAVFLTGIVFLLIGRQEIISTSSILLPSVLFILGISCFMLFLDNTSDKAVLLAAVVFIVIGFINVTITGALGLSSFIKSLTNFISDYWLVLLVSAVVIFLVSRPKEKEE